MFKKITTFAALSAIASIAWFTKEKYDLIHSDKVFYSFVAISSSYFFLKLLLEGFVSKQIKEFKARYSFRKATQLLFIVISFIIVLRIWVPNPQALLVAYGLVAAGVAISLQDVFKNFAGALSIFLSGIYRVGDRIEINAKYGDVIDIGPFYTTTHRVARVGGWRSDYRQDSFRAKWPSLILSRAQLYQGPQFSLGRNGAADNA